ncbi:filamentous hemagglutinin N-terminal domain-containing protein [Burkholderia stabilis]|uniref:Filamentous hemagglutinin N-terminal domain-containing protein n=1 Tax=Burkholderia stabilis TaxID=95485 RepID=A0A4V1PRY2_9BURK|nr:hemagglutinin repeat-containing protein [Burkholderia stabilis]RXV69184.1 filamentous hemagglutinin N-terminal domain-containing protein [Burkholderia stabilis]
MNKNQYRLVFSRVRGMLVAVEETANATGKTSRGESVCLTAGSVRRVLSRFALRHVAFAALVAGGATPVWVDAQVVGAGAHAPSVIQTQNGIQQVNITKPSGAGVSLNTYSQFDVPKAGVIVNNSPVLTNTQQAGYINGNPNFGANDAAKIIINQVNSNNPSQLKGFVEIAGQRAEMIISNPSGLVVDGGGFINTSRAILTTGTPNLNADGSLAGFNVTRGLITVQGAGLNATNVDQVDLISRAVQANAAIYASNLNVVTGANQVNHDTLQTTRIQGDGAAPAVAIDVGQLGGMYSNRIFLVGTEGGVGVRNAGTIAADAMGLTLTTDGRLVQSGKVSSLGSVAVSAAGGIENSGTTYGQQSVSLNTGADVVNTGTVAAQHDVGVTAGSLNSTGLLGAGVDSNGAVTQAGDLQVTTTGQLNATGKNVAGGNVSATGYGVNLAGSTTAANGNLSMTATGGDVNLANATTSAQGAVTANAAGTVINDHGNLTSGGSTTLTGANVSNQSGSVSSQGPLSVTAAGQIANQSGLLVSESTMALRGNTIVNNQGTIQSAGRATVDGSTIDNTAGRVTSVGTEGLVLTATGQLTNVAGTTANGAQGGVIGGNGDVTVQGGNIANRATITSNTNLRVAGQSIDNDSGTLKAAQNVAVDAGAHLSNSGGAITGQTATLSGTTLDNSSGTVQADQVSLNATNVVNHAGTITQTGTGAMTVNVSNTLDNSSGGTLQTNSTDLTLAPASLVNDGGTITHAGTGTLTLGNGAGSISNAGGAVVSNGQISAQSATLVNTNGTISGKAGLAATVTGTLNNSSGKLLSSGNLSVDGGTLTNANGVIGSAANATIQVVTLTNSGQIMAGQTATIGATSVDNNSGTIQGAQVGLTASNVSNQGGTITQTGTGAMAVNVSDTLDNSNGGTLQTNSTDLTLAPATLVNDGGTITHAGTGTLTLGNGTGSISNVGGAIASNGHVVAKSGSLNNTLGSITGQTGLTATVGGALNNTNGKLLSNTDLGITSGTLTNDGGQIGASTNASIQVGSMTNQGGSIVAPNLSVTANSTLDNSGGKLEANQLALTAKDLTNHGGTVTQYGSGAMGINVSDALDNSAAGVIQTNSTDLTLAPAQLNNAGGTITHAGTGTLTIEPGNGASGLNNAAGTIVTKGQAVVDASSWDNSGGIFAAQRGITSTIAGDVNNAQGLIRSGTSLSLANGGALVNQAGHIQAGQQTAGDASTLSIQSGSINNADGAIADLGSGKMTVQGGSQITNSHAGNVQGMGAITGNGDVTVSATSIANTQGGQLSGTSLHVRGTSLDNSGGQIGNVTNANGNVDVTTSGAITNTNGQISSTHDLTVTASTLQGGGAYSATHDANVNLQGDYTATSNTQFNVGNNLAFTLPGTFTNNATLQSVNGLSVDAGNIVNTGALSAGGLLHTQSGNLSNTGALVGGSVSLNATGTVSNVGPTALIGASDSNGTLEILANDIENRDDTTATDAMATTAIFGMGKVVLAGGKDASGNYTNAALVNNSSALIQSGGDMELHADKVTNTRRVMTTSTGSIDPSTLAQFGVPIKGQTGQVGVKDPTSIGGVYTDPPHGGQWNSTYQYTTYYADSATATTVTSISPAAQIVSGGSINASTVATLQNYWSSITAVGNVQMPKNYDANGFAATGQQAPSVTVSYSGQYHYNNYDNSEYNWQLPFGNAPFVTGRPGGYTQAAPASVKQYSLPGYDSTLGTNGTISGTGVSINNTAGNASIPSLGLLPGQAVAGLTYGTVSGSASVSKTAGGMVNGTLSGSPVQSATVNGKSVAPVDPIIASATALNVLNNLTIPQGGLYRPDPSPNASYVIETNPAFTNQKNFISSDYFFGQLGVDLTHIPKRLGDGFYEQQLVRNEVTALTGKAVLGPYSDLQTMYESLMAAGAALEKQLNLPLGASLSADQVSKLTGNVIMMETRVVDGQSVLVPVVYLAQANQQNINGPLITATDIDLKDAQNFTNSGTMKADNTLSVQGKQIDNAFGALQSGGLMSLTTTGNVDLTSAQVKAGSLNLNAGGDLILDTAVKTDTRVSRDGATSVTSTLGPIAQLNVTGDAAIVTGGNFQQNAGNLSVGGDLGMNVGGNWDLGAVQTGEHKIVQRANGVSNTDINNVVGSAVKVGGVSSIGVGGDITAQGAQIEFGQGGTVAAKGNISLGTASATSTVNSNSSGSDSHGSYAETLHTSDQALTATTLKGGDTVTLASGKDLTINGSTISLDKGNANLLAAGDVNIGAATETHELNSHETHSHSNVVSGAKVASGIDQTATYSQGSTVSADGVNIVSNRDINVTGSNVVGTNDVRLQATRDVNIKTSQDSTQSSSYYEKKESGLLTNGGLSVTVGSRSTAQQDQNSSVTNKGSVIGSSQGNVTIQAGKDATITGSTVVAGQDVGITGQNVTVNAAYDTYKDAQSQQFSQSGLSVGLGGGLVGLGQSMASVVRQGQQSGDSRLAAVQAVAAAEQAYQNRGGIKDAANALSSGNVSEAAKGVQVQISIGSSHSSSNSTTSITSAKGSSVIGNGNVSITATGTQDANGNAQAGTGNIAMTGATVLGKNVALDANNAITLQSAQSTEQDTSSNSSSGWNAGVGIGVGKNTGISVFANGTNSHGQGNGDSATQTNTTVTAGNALTMRSGGDTTLTGAQVSGDKVKADVGGNLTMTSVQDTSNYTSNQHNSGVSGSFTFGYGGGVDASIGHTGIDANYASVNQQTGIVAGKGGFDVSVVNHTQLNGAQIASAAPAESNTLTTGSLGFSNIQNSMSYSASSEGFSTSSGPSFAQTSDHASGVTQAAVSPAKIVVKSDQQNGTDSTAGLSRDTTSANQTVQNTFNLQQVQNDLAFAQAFGKAATFAVAEAATQLENSSPQMKALFGEGGAGRDVLHAAVAAIGAALSGGNIGGAVAGSLTGDLLQSLAQPIIDQAVSQLPLDAQAAARKALNEIVATAGGAAGGALAGGGSGTLAGAGAAANNELYNRQLHQSEAEKLQQLQKNQSPQEQYRLAAAECALVHCADNIPDSDPSKAILQKMQNDGAQFAYEKDVLTKAGAFDGYSKLDRLNDAYDRNQVSNRLMGAVQGVTGVATGTAAALGGCYTLVACIAGGAVAGISFDYAKAGFTQAVNGNPTPTYGELALQSLGMSPGAAAMTYAALGLGATVGSVAANNAAVQAAAKGVPQSSESVQAGIKNDLVQQVADLRSTLTGSAKTSGNVGVAQINIPGIQPTMAASSQISTPTAEQQALGFVGKVPETFPSSNVWTSGNDPILLNRSADSEAKILNNIAAQLGDNTSVSGTINLLTERAPCTSCSNVIQQFESKYPNIKVNVMDNGGVIRPTKAGK